MSPVAVTIFIGSEDLWHMFFWSVVVVGGAWALVKLINKTF